VSARRARKTRALDRREGPVAAPKSEIELLARAHRLAGVTLAELARSLGLVPPPEPSRHKGLIGEWVEVALGASGRGAGIDFPQLGIELKTIPVSRDGRPRESTFVCTISERKIADSEWERSAVRAKLARVLWVPIESDPALLFGQRRIGAARLWSPSIAQEAELHADWEELAAVIGRGDSELLSAHLGRSLQVRPKAPHGGTLTRGIDEHGAPTRAQPRAFYLRARFTAQLFGVATV
jgi:DNA mismatch repair protein MutH